MPRPLLIAAVILALFPTSAAWARGGGGCFPAGTPILTPGGSTPIEQLQPGDQLLAFDPAGSGDRTVTTTLRGIVSVEVEQTLLITAGPFALRVTPDHPFYVGAGDFRAAGSLHVGDSLMVYDARALRRATITGIEAIPGPTTVYNLQADDPHTFFAAGLAVHNKGGGCFAAGTLVATPAGDVPVELLKPGQRVLGFDPLDPAGRLVPTTARSLISLPAPRSLLLRVGSVGVRVTPEHPFLTDGPGGRMFCLAGDLRVGATVFVRDGGQLVPRRIDAIEPSDQALQVYNLTVDPPHTFLAAGLAVHNKGGGGFGGGGFGGGWGYGGGYHSGSWGTSGSATQSSGGDAAFITLVVLFAVLFGVIKAVQHQHEAGQDLDFTFAPAVVARKAGKTLKLLEFIAQQDPGMTPDKLVAITRETFLLLQKCWHLRAYDAMKPRLMPDLYAEHLKQLQAMIDQHEVNMITDLGIERIDLVNVRYTESANQREFTALVSAHARDYYVDDRTRDFLRGDQTVARFQEFWTFHQFDGKWLLREIEQSRESDALKNENFFEAMTDQELQHIYGQTPGTTGSASGGGGGGPAGPWTQPGAVLKESRTERLLNFLARSDPMWDRALLLERARSVFIAIAAARQGSNPGLVPDGDLFPDAATHLRAEIATRAADGLTLELRNLCVRKVELILVRHYTDKSRDGFTVRINAHAQRVLRRGAHAVSQDPDVQAMVEYWTFGRMGQAWRLKEVLPPAKGQAMVSLENVDEEATAGQLQWFYTKPRAG